MRPFFQITLPILSFFVLLLVYTKIFGPIPFSINSVTTTKTDTFNVTGEGSVAIKPDIVLLNVGISAQGSTVKMAQDQINAVSAKVAEAIKKLGVDQKDIQTSNYNINPTYDYQARTQKITGYTASTNLTIKVRNIDLVNQVIDQATANGANQIGSITFDVDDRTKAENDARVKAVADAKKKAESAAKIAGFRLGKMVNYSENFAGGPQPFRALSQAVGGVPAETKIEPGSSEIKVIVILSYEIQ